MRGDQAKLWATMILDACRKRFGRRPLHEDRLQAVFALQLAGQFEAALEGYEALRAAAPADLRIVCGMAACARVTGRLEYASTLVDGALRDFPFSRAVLAEAAQIEEQHGRWSSSLGYWARIVHTPDAHSDWRHHYILNLITLGRFEEAAPPLGKWLRLDPDHRGFLALEAMLASGKGKLDEALGLWSDYRRRFPDDRTGWEHYGRAYQAKQMSLFEGADTAGVAQAAPQAVELHEDPDARALLMGFESLGHDCEFGLVQRRFGAEPLGLLRFNAVGFGGLLAAIANGFAGMGEPDNTELILSANGEYYVADRRWGLGMHTFIFKGQDDPDRLYGKLCRRVAYLRDRFLEDCAEGRKILVYTCPGLAGDDLRLLHRALRSLGPAALLHVAFASDAGAARDAAKDAEWDAARGAPGTVSGLGDGLYVGYISRAGKAPSLDWNISFDEWVGICGQVRRLVAAGG